MGALWGDSMSLIDEIKSHVRVSDVAAQYGEVWQRGRLQVCRCLCGGNTDRNPSFTLYEDDNHFHCYACQRHGSVIDLVMLAEQLDLRQALAWLRKRYLSGIDTSDVSLIKRQTPHVNREMFELSTPVCEVLAAVTQHYHQTLLNTPSALEYLHRRGVSDDTVQVLRLGYANGNLGRSLHTQGRDLTLAARIGLLHPRGELLADRLILPVLDQHNAPVWLIGRATQDRQQPKYLGLPDGLTRKQPMVTGVAKRGILLVEGAIDFAALVQWGMTNEWLCVGLLGTAHGKVIEQLARQHSRAQVTLALDQDAAGKDAALKAALALRELGLQPIIVVDADRHARQRASANAAREVAVVEQMQQHDLVRWVHWHATAKDCGDLLMQGNAGEAMFQQAVRP